MKSTSISTALMLSLLMSIQSVMAAPKLLSCENWNAEDTELKSKYELVFDTDDFQKESPEYEFTLTYDSTPEDKIWLPQESFGQLTGEARPLYFYETHGTGTTYRYNFEVTASTLTFSYRTYPECPWKIRKIISSCTDYSIVNVSRADLTSDLGWKCSLEDVDVSDNLI